MPVTIASGLVKANDSYFLEEGMRTIQIGTTFYDFSRITQNKGLFFGDAFGQMVWVILPDM
jgi:hypothetical protein